MNGRPGVSYIDLPGNMITEQVETSRISFPSRCPDPPRPLAELEQIKTAIELLKQGKSPLVIVGKGSASARAERPAQEFITLTGFPFLPTPMGKGVIPDDHQQCVAAARSTALKKADVILLLGARLNWILHFGLPPRFRSDVKLIQVDIQAEELGNNVQASVALQGDLLSVSQQLCDEWRQSLLKSECLDSWWSELKKKVIANKQYSKELSDLNTKPMSYYQVFGKIQQYLDRDSYVISEGANTMDIGRTMLQNMLPRRRLDAGTCGTMGVGLGFAIAAAMYTRDHYPQPKIFCIEGDSAFGFSGMEYETACRYKLPIIFVIINNNGVFSGVDEETWRENIQSDPSLKAPPTSLLPNSHYEKLASAFGGNGYFATTQAELSAALKDIFSYQRSQPVIINVMIDTTSQRKSQEFFWMTKSNL
jgi:2-hydroxyacyl-CoA lyase 1